jgi:hypothetical protein
MSQHDKCYSIPLYTFGSVLGPKHGLGKNTIKNLYSRTIWDFAFGWMVYDIFQSSHFKAPNFFGPGLIKGTTIGYGTHLSCCDP